MNTKPLALAVPHDNRVESALAFAANEAERRRAPLRLVHVFDAAGPEPEPVQGFIPELPSAYASGTNVLWRAREAVAGLVKGEVELDCRPLEGSLRETLVDAAGGASLMVLQRRDHGRVRRLVTRSTSSGVAARASTAVVVVPEAWHAHDRKVVTVGVDEITRGKGLLTIALDEAASRGALLRVVHAIWSVAGLDDVLVEQATARRRVAQAMRDLDHAVQAIVTSDPSYRDVKVDLDVRHERPGEMLLSAAEDSDLVIVGRHDPLLPIGSHLGPVCGGLLRESPVPVMVVDPR